MGKPKTGGSRGRIANRLVALSSAAVLTVYSAGYLRTRAAAQKLDAAERSRVVIPAAPSGNAQPVAAVTPAAPVPAKSPAPAPRATTKRPAATSAPVTVSTQPSPTPADTPVAAATIPLPTPTPIVAEPPPPATAPAPVQYKDGVYAGWGTSRHGDIEATVTIANGKIASAVISQCLTRYSCSWVAHLQGQVVERQSPEVDYVSRATQSTNAFYYAVVQALSKAK